MRVFSEIFWYQNAYVKENILLCSRDCNLIKCIFKLKCFRVLETLLTPGKKM